MAFSGLAYLLYLGMYGAGEFVRVYECRMYVLVGEFEYFQFS
jgi:hypothetical protein